MPYSNSTFDQAIKDFIINHRMTKYLDIGAGAGKYGSMIKKAIPLAFVEAVEIDKKYIIEFQLHKIYNTIHNCDINNFIDDNPDYVTDVVIIGDCIEHLRKSIGLDLINYFVYRCKYIIIIFPSKYIQYSWCGHSHEAHISVWSEKDFVNFDHSFIKQNQMNMVIIRGYIN